MQGIKNIIFLAISTLVVVLSLTLRPKNTVSIGQETSEPEVKTYTYNIDPKDFTLTKGEIGSGESLSTILDPHGVTPLTISKIAATAEDVYSLKNMRAGFDYTIYSKMVDSLEQVEHFVFETNVTDYVVISILGDSVSVISESKPVEYKRRTASGTISSSLWNCMIENGMSPALVMDMSEIYAWSIDFFGLQKDDSFKIIYDEKFVDTTMVGAGKIWGMEFTHAGKVHYAIPFDQDGRLTYWDENGNSLRKNLLKAPLRYSRISSKFSYSRLHPILKIRRPHLGVDYAAPMGTPVVAVADGVVTYRRYDRGGGNTLKIKHAANMASGYLHLRSFAKGVTVGARVNQGQVIGYVGSTGMSTGPHLDFRLWRGGTPIDPLKAPSKPTEPINDENLEAFNVVKMSVLAELNGQIAENI